MIFLLLAQTTLITIPANVLDVPKGEANYCYNDDTGAVVCEYRPPETIVKPVKPNIPYYVPNSRTKRARG